MTKQELTSYSDDSQPYHCLMVALAPANCSYLFCLATFFFRINSSASVHSMWCKRIFLEVFFNVFINIILIMLDDKKKSKKWSSLNNLEVLINLTFWCLL